MSKKIKQKKEKIYIFDTTLRDGNQTDRNKMTVEQKVMFAHQLSRLGVDAIEAGFPESNETDFISMRRIAEEVEGPIIYGLARTKKRDLDAVFEVIQHSKDPGIHTFIATSDEHITEKLGMTRETVMKEAVSAVRHAASIVPNVIFSPEDGTRSDWAYMADVCSAVIGAGATVLNIPDTVGFATPEIYSELINYLFENVDGINGVRVSTHIHNDRGLATAVTLSGVLAGAREVQCTINGIGERAGNASLEQIAVNLRDTDFRMPENMKNYCYGNGFYTDINLSFISATSNMLSEITGNEPGHHQPLIGKNVFQHEAGIHQQNTTAYETIPAEMIGREGGILVIGAHSGRRGIRKAADKLGYSLTTEQVGIVADRIKQLDDVKTEVSGEDLAAYVEEVAFSVPERYQLIHMHYSGGTGEQKFATVVINVDGKEITEMAYGDGPVDASCNAIKKITGIDLDMHVDKYDALGSGSDVQLKVKAYIHPNGHRVFGIGVNPDSVSATVNAYINCLNRAHYLKDNGKLE